MPNPTSEFVSLFRSIKPDDTDFQTSKSVAANEAAQRWPLFKAMLPEKPEPTPPLSEQERARWDSQGASGARLHKSVLSVPTTSFDMASSLHRMAGVKQIPDAAATLVAAQTSIKSANKSKEMSSPAPPPPPDLQRSDHRTSEVGATNPKIDNQKSARSGPFEGHWPRSQAPTTVIDEPVASKNSLASIFSRLEGKRETLAKPSTPIASFFDRLGRR